MGSPVYSAAEIAEETVVTVHVSSSQLLRLQELAAKLGVTVEALLQLAIEDFLEAPDDEAQKLSDYLLTKNQELYGRLA